MSVMVRDVKVGQTFALLHEGGESSPLYIKEEGGIYKIDLLVRDGFLTDINPLDVDLKGGEKPVQIIHDYWGSD